MSAVKNLCVLLWSSVSEKEQSHQWKLKWELKINPV